MTLICSARLFLCTYVHRNVCFLFYVYRVVPHMTVEAFSVLNINLLLVRCGKFALLVVCILTFGMQRTLGEGGEGGSILSLLHICTHLQFLPSSNKPANVVLLSFI